jgi:glyoxylate reductase
MAKVVVGARVPGDIVGILEGHDVIEPSSAAFERAPLLAALADADALLSTVALRVDAELFDAAPRVRIVANFGVGYDNVDVEEASRRGILVTNTPDVLTNATADLTMALLLGAARRLYEGAMLVRSGAWTGWVPDQLLGVDLDGAILGVVGLGRIGAAVAKRARAFGVSVVYTGRTRAHEDVERSLGARFVLLDQLLEISDFVSIHCPLTDATRHLFDADAISRMKRGAILVNTARGPIVDEAALLEALDGGHLFAAALDVFAREPLLADALRAHPRTMLAPHLGSATLGARRAMGESAATAIRDGLSGARPRHLVSGGAR